MSRSCYIFLGALLFAACQPPEDEKVVEETQPLPDVAFQDVTFQVGLGDFSHITGAFGDKWFPETMGAGGGFLDYDGDGWLDILLVRGNPFPSRNESAPSALRLYRNVEGTSFVEVTSETGLGELKAYAFGITVADYDNDGDPDVFVTALFTNLLLRNDGGSFTEVAASAGLADEAVWSAAAVFFDADRDGFLDLYVGNYVDWGLTRIFFVAALAHARPTVRPSSTKKFLELFTTTRAMALFLARWACSIRRLAKHFQR